MYTDNNGFLKIFFCFYLLTGYFIRDTAFAQTQNQTIKGCEFPENLKNGKLLIKGGTVKVECNRGYKLYTNNTERPNQHIWVMCLQGKWSAILPNCRKLCSSFQCRNNSNVTCYECTEFYASDTHASAVFCFGGFWKSFTPKCLPVCGTHKVGHSIQTTHFPWTAAIYRIPKNKEELQYKCEANILTKRIIVTVAHCVSDWNGVPVTENLKLFVGKFGDTQLPSIHKMLIHPKYKGELQQMAYNIAIIVTQQPLTMTEAVQPACFRGIRNLKLTNSITGVLSRWTYTELATEPDEFNVILSYQDDNTCVKQLPDDFLKRTSLYDKFCAGTSTNNLCMVSGSGLTFVNDQDERYYLHGISSAGVNRCDNIFLFTRIADYSDWLEEIIAQYSDLTS